ncbi:thioredoxin family protein [Sphingobacterium sp. NGMCC 1.201703]|uniref:thioredoxin family protein n=1 Tax=Sphingobacterium sp. NGMCC 1.201703 TaxID=3388657 RepID=UPI0039FC4497
MKRLLLTSLAFVQSMILLAQDHIQFQKLTFSEAKELAKKENKLIFLDGFTSWCAPCKWMEGNVFSQPEVAAYFNTRFINTKFDCEVGEGVEIAKNYQIKSFPTYLFLDGKGTLIYRTQSRMEADLFLKQAQQANDPDYQIPNLRKQYDQGLRESNFLLRYIKVMEQTDSKAANNAKKTLDSVATDEFLLSPNGWETIKMMAQSYEDRYGKFFESNKSYFKSVALAAEFENKETQLLRYAMYGYIRDNKAEEFRKGLAYFEQSNKSEHKIDAAMYQVEWTVAHGTEKEFVSLTDHLRKGLLKEEDEKLSFIARRNANVKGDAAKPSILKQCYILAKQAVEMNPSSYSNQGTLADICIALKKKKEAIKAAEAARGLAELETSKIIKLADALLERAKSL